MNARGQTLTDAKCPSTAEADIGETTVLQILRVADLLTRIGDSKVFGKELTQAQFNILMILKRHGQNGMSQKEIMGYLVSTKGNVSIHITNLARMGYVRKKTSKIDSRRNVITLTAKGRRMLQELEPRYIRHLREITDDLPREQAESTIALLNQLMGKCEYTLGNSETGKGITS
jgi:MarR family 2-MHQ and catechol resistance regulon transcriptional repressor